MGRKKIKKERARPIRLRRGSKSGEYKGREHIIIQRVKKDREEEKDKGKR